MFFESRDLTRMRKRLRPACTNKRRSSVNMITSFPDIRKRADDFSRRITFCRRHETRNCSWLHVCSFVIHTGVITHSKKKNKRHSAVLITTTITRNEKTNKRKRTNSTPEQTRTAKRIREHQVLSLGGATVPLFFLSRSVGPSLRA